MCNFQYLLNYRYKNIIIKYYETNNKNSNKSMRKIFNISPNLNQVSIIIVDIIEKLEIIKEMFDKG